MKGKHVYKRIFILEAAKKIPLPHYSIWVKKIQAPPMLVTKIIPLPWRAIKFLAPDVSSETSLTIDMGNSIISVYTVYAYLENCS